MNHRLDLATGPIDALGQLAEGLRLALKLPYVGVAATDPRLPEIHAGRRRPAAERLPAPGPVGRSPATLVVAHRFAGERFTSAERAVLGDVAQRAGELLGSAAMFHDLQRSRERLVAAREEERRRLRRDLHDGVGPQLAALAIQLDSLARRLARRPRPGTPSAAAARPAPGDRRARCGASWTTCGRPPSTTSASSAPLREHAAAFTADGAPLVEWAPRRRFRAAGRGRGRGVPDRDGGRDERRPALGPTVRHA